MNVKTQDFDDNNVLSYCYANKEHKSYELDKKKTHVIALMQNHFQSQDRLMDMDVKTATKNQDAKTRAEAAQELKKIETKRKEMEAKAFQDQQIAEKQMQRQLILQQKSEEFKRQNEEYSKYKLDEAQAKKDKFNKNRAHLDLVMKQMKDKPRGVGGATFAKTGVAIIKAIGTPQRDTSGLM